MRKTKEQLEKIKKKHNASRIWSWSRYKKYKDAPYEFYLSYIKKETPDKENTTIYGISGNCCHDILEDFYSNKIKYTDCITRYENSLFDMEMADLKYDRTDEDMNSLIADKYENSIRHYFNNFIPIDKKVALEKFVLIKVGKHLLQGYLDCTFKDEDGIYYILDFKTSSIYKGEKLKKELGQLFLYAMALTQMGVPLDKIRIGYDFLKYSKVSYEQKNGKTKERTVIRRDMIKELKTPIKMWLTNFKYNDIILEEAIEKNTFDVLPDEVKAKFTVSNGYLWIQPTQEDLDNLAEDINNTLNEIIVKELKYEQTQDDKLFWHEITQADSYYYYNLSSYSRYKNPVWNEYLEQIEMFVDKEEDYFE